MTERKKSLTKIQRYDKGILKEHEFYKGKGALAVLYQLPVEDLQLLVKTRLLGDEVKYTQLVANVMPELMMDDD